MNEHNSRRRFLRHGARAAVFFGALTRMVPLRAAGGAAQRRGKLLAAFVDTLIPPDLTPSASQLKLDRRLVAHAARIVNYPQLLELGAQWLDAQASAQYGLAFEALRPEQRDRIVAQAEASPRNGIPKMFFDRVLADLMSFYYAEPASWAGMGFESPPQPRGYPDYTLAPARRTNGQAGV